MINKRGQSMSTNTIVLLILAVIVLVVLILGFTIGWNKLAPWISKTNVKDIVGTCQTACATQSKYDFCGVMRNVIDADKNKVSATCAVLSKVSQFDSYGVEDCALDCVSLCESIKINDVSGVGTQPTSGSFYDVSSLSDEGACFIPIPSK